MIENLIPPLEPESLKPQLPKKEPHKITITIQDMDVELNQIDIMLKNEPEITQNVPMTAALSVAQQVLELLTIIREKAMTTPETRQPSE